MNWFIESQLLVIIRIEWWNIQTFKTTFLKNVWKYKNLPLLNSFLRPDRKISELDPILIKKAGSALDLS